MQFPAISFEKPALVLAPMEGVTDGPMRALLTQKGGFTYCVSEFLRISQNVPSARTFIEHIPELQNQARTSAGIPVQVQLLGGDEEKMAMAAVQAVAAGATAIDLNFGCPSPTVNRHDGGAALLKFPERIENLVRAVRSAVPQPIPVSAKVRLGWDNPEDIFENANRAWRGGASWITIHARTKVQGYTPPAHWHYITETRKRIGVPLIANGEIWTLEDFLKCRDETGCEHYMIGRGAIANPLLAHQIATELGLPIVTTTALSWESGSLEDWSKLLTEFAALCAPFSKNERFAVCRFKQWLHYVNKRTPLSFFDTLKRTNSLSEMYQILNGPQSL